MNVVEAQWVKVADESALSSEEVLQVFIGETAIGLVKLSDGVFAFDDVCTHEHAYLSEGFVEDECVECPLHGSQFEIRTGAVKSLPALRNLRTYEVRVEDGSVYLKSEGI